jgi:phosphopantetheinyl transferase
VEPVTGRETEVAWTFSAAERATLGRMDVGEATRATLRTWCRKEALLKAFGLGLDDVLACGALADDDPRKWIAPRAVAGAWWLADLPTPGDHVAAVAAAAPAAAVVVEQVSGRDLLAPRRPPQPGRMPAAAGAWA